VKTRIPVNEVARAEMDVLYLADRWQRSWLGSLVDTCAQARELAQAVRKLRRLQRRAARTLYAEVMKLTADAVKKTR
jgi:hypothetical protein